MKKEYIEPFVRATLDTFETMMGVTVEPLEYMLDVDITSSYDIFGVMQISGGVEGVVILGFTKDAAIHLVSRFIKTEPLDTIKALEDSIGEIVNIVSGYTRKFTKDFRFDISLPKVYSSPSYFEACELQGFSVVIPFSTGVGPFFLEIRIKEMPGLRRDTVIDVIDEVLAQAQALIQKQELPPCDIRLVQPALADLLNVYTEVDDNKILKIFTDKERLNAYLYLEITGTNVTPSMILNSIRGRGIKIAKANQETIKKMIEEAFKNREGLKYLLIAKGIPPTQGKPPKLRWARDFFGISESDLETRARYERSSVKSGELVLSCEGFQEPSEGFDVFGNKIEVPKQVFNVRAGQNIRADNQTNTFYATLDGILEFDKQTWTVSVAPILWIPSNVGVETGNIDYLGRVIVGGNVHDGAEIRAGLGIQVDGTVGAAMLYSDKDVSIAGGMNGEERGKIIAKGDIRVSFLDNVTVECKGDVLVTKEILNSRIFCLGAVKLVQGSIKGGEICARGGIEAFRIGTELGTKTVLRPGVDYTLKKTLEELDQQIIKLKNTIDKIRPKITLLMERLKELTPAQREVCTELNERVFSMKNELETKQKLRENLYKESRKKSVKRILIEDRILPGVTIQIGQDERIIEEELQGPLEITLHEALHIDKIVIRPRVKSQGHSSGQD